MSNVVPFSRDGQYTDIRVAIRDVLEKYPEATKDIVIIFSENEMIRLEVCNAMEVAYAAVDLMHMAATDTDVVR